MIQLRFVYTLGALFSALAIAQEPVPPLPPPSPAHMGMETRVVAGEGDFFYLQAHMGMDKLVKGAPYSAQAVTEYTQTLADGNRIHRTTTASVARDSEGRTRREETVIAMGPLAGSGETPKSIFIHDPVAGSSYVLDPDSRTAHQLREPKAIRLSPESGDPSAKIMKMKAEARGHGTMSETQAKTEDLGTQVIEGVTAQGKRVTRVIPAGHIGNEKPLEIVMETWYSSELQTTVMSKTNDPRTGEVSYKLTGVSRAEPDPALFQVPADYKVTQGDERPLRINLKEE